MFVGPGVTTTNDDTMGRHGPTTSRCGARRCDAPAASAAAPCSPPAWRSARRRSWRRARVVTRDVPARAVVMGVPARVVREVGEEDLLERWR